MSWNCLFTFKKVSQILCGRKFDLFQRHSTLNHATFFHKMSFLQNQQQMRESAATVDLDSESNENVANELCELKLKILDSSLNFVPEHGWTKKSIALGAQSLGLSSMAHSLIQDGGCELVHHFNFMCNENLYSYLQESSPATTETKNLQQYIENALENRLRMIIPFVSQWSEAMSLMIIPTQVPADLKNLYDLVDIIWCNSGFKSINGTWYSKRIALATAYKSCELSLVQDKSPDFSDTFDFLPKQVELVINTDEFFKEISVAGKHLPDNISGTLITIRNMLGANKLFR